MAYKIIGGVGVAPLRACDEDYADLVAEVVGDSRVKKLIYTGASKKTNHIIEAKTGNAMGWGRTSANEFARSKSGKL